VQHDETAFAFISRLMESAGIFYFFTFKDGSHTMVLADSGSVHKKIEGTNEVRVQRAGAAAREIEYFWDFRPASEVASGTAILTDYNFETPKASLEVRSQHKASYDIEQGEVFDYPGKYDKADTGQPIAKVRIEELQAEASFSRGEGNVRGVTAGGLVKVSLAARSADQIDYLIVETDIRAEAIDTDPPELVAARSQQERLQNRFRIGFGAIPSATPFRPARKTKRPVIGGPHTALVVGKEGEEIWTDKYGRIRVQFFWDRLGKKDENSTCWVRVVQAWAGAQWGTIFLPRIGQEVMVQFLEGDPDRPVVTGSLYNADMMPPYALTANMIHFKWT
jgi:type VI secretion system secreted protein VgrG